MRLRNIFVLLVLFFALIVSNPELAQNQEEEQWDKDNYGKVVIQVLDVNSEPVKEIFNVIFFNSLKLDGLQDIDKITELIRKTNDKGHLVVNLKPGIYYLQYLPESIQSKYAYEPSPLLTEFNRQQIAVESQKITKVFKKVNYAGKLKIVLVDPNGTNLNPEEVFSKNFGISLNLFSGNGLVGCYMNEYKSEKDLTKGTDDLNDGRLVIGRLYPGEYGISINFGSMGYKGKIINDIQIFNNQTTVKEILVNINDTTGIEGYVTDQYGNPLENLYIEVDGAMFETDKNGYYRIVGIDVGIHDIDISSGELSEIIITKHSKVEIINDIIVKKNFKIELK